MIIGFGYKARSGKDTAADYIVENYDFSKHSFAFYLKALLWFLFGIEQDELINGDKTRFVPMWGMTIREMLQKVGTDALRNNFDQDIWVKLTLGNYEGEDLVFSDVRFENEAARIKELGGLMIRIDRPGVSIEDSTAAHESENGLSHYMNWDYVITNDGTVEDLYKEIDLIMAQNNIPKKPQDPLLQNLPKGFAG